MAEAAPLFSPQKDDVIDGHLIVRPSIAHGSTGVIHEAIDPQGRRCVIKILDKEGIIKRFKGQFRMEPLSKEESEKKSTQLYNDALSQFKREYQILIGMSHPNIAKVYNFGFVKDHFILRRNLSREKQSAIIRCRWNLLR